MSFAEPVRTKLPSRKRAPAKRAGAQPVQAAREAIRTDRGHHRLAPQCRHFPVHRLQEEPGPAPTAAPWSYRRVSRSWRTKCPSESLHTLNYVFYRCAPISVPPAFKYLSRPRLVANLGDDARLDLTGRALTQKSSEPRGQQRNGFGNGDTMHRGWETCPIPARAAPAQAPGP